jgi:hypothetical protein
MLLLLHCYLLHTLSLPGPLLISVPNPSVVDPDPVGSASFCMIRIGIILPDLDRHPGPADPELDRIWSYSVSVSVFGFRWA